LDNVTQVASVVWYEDKIFAIDGDQLDAVDLTTYNSLTEGTFYSGRINYRMDDVKHFRYVDVVTRCPHADDTIEVFYSTDGDTWTSVGTCTNADPKKQLKIDVADEWIELRFDFTQGAATSTPVLERFTLRALPVPKRTRQIQLPLDLREKYSDGYGAPDLVDVMSTVLALEALVESGATVTYTEFDQTYDVSLENVQWGPELDVNTTNSDFEGICVVTLRIY